MTTNLKTKYANVLTRPRITEKATMLGQARIYAFEIAPSADKKTVSAAIKAYFGVSPNKVRILRNPAKRVIVRGKRGVKPGVKKAYVYLKEGDKIE